MSMLKAIHFRVSMGIVLLQIHSMVASTLREYRLYMASRDYRDTEWQPMRIVNVGPIYYNMTVADDGTTTIGKTRGRARLHLNNASKRGE